MPLHCPLTALQTLIVSVSLWATLHSVTVSGKSSGLCVNVPDELRPSQMSTALWVDNEVLCVKRSGFVLFGRGYYRKLM